MAWLLDKVKAVANRASEMTHEATHNEAALLFDFKREALQNARSAAEAEGRKPTMTDFYIAAETLGETRGAEMAKNNISWGPRVYSDLSGQTMDGFNVRQADITPSPQMRRAAAGMVAAQGGKPTVINTLRAMQQLQNTPPQGPQAQAVPVHSLSDFENMMDLDGDHAISGYYGEIESQTRFHDTIFSNTSFHPAGTLMKYDAEGATFHNVTFDGMEDRDPKDTVTLTGGKHQNITFTNINGGVIEVADNAQINGLDIRGAHAELQIGRASINHLDAREAHIVSLKAKPGAEIAHAHFEGASIDMISEVRGTSWKDVKFTGANLDNVDMSGAKLTNVRFADAHLKNLNLNGAQLNNVQFNQSHLEGLQVDDQTRFNNVSVNGFPINSKADFALAASFHQAADVLRYAVKTIQQNQPDAGRDFAALGAAFVNARAQEASLAHVEREGAGKAVAELARPEPARSPEAPVMARSTRA